MLNATELKNGTCFTYYDSSYRVLKYDHVTKSRGGATVRVKAQNIVTKSITIITMSAGQKIEPADIENRNMRYLYADKDFYHFMDDDNFEEITIDLKKNIEKGKYLLEGSVFQILFCEGATIDIILPASMFYKIVKDNPAVRGNTESRATKRVVLENGLEVDVPLFVKLGDIVKINTTTCMYSGRGT